MLRLRSVNVRKKTFRALQSILPSVGERSANNVVDADSSWTIPKRRPCRTFSVRTVQNLTGGLYDIARLDDEVSFHNCVRRGSGSLPEGISLDGTLLTVKPFELLLSKLARDALVRICEFFRYPTSEKLTRANLLHLISANPGQLDHILLVFKFTIDRGPNTEPDESDVDACIDFPPDEPSVEEMERTINAVRKGMDPFSIEWHGCMVCGRLHHLENLLPKDAYSPAFDDLLDVHVQKGIPCAKIERSLPTDPQTWTSGPILDDTCTHICKNCHYSLSRGRAPRFALAAGFWVGVVPMELRGLSFVERLLISAVQTNMYVVRVKGVRLQMRANAICFQSPIAKVYKALPPAREDVEDILAYIFAGPENPSKDTLKRVPMFVRKNRVVQALQWLSLNHVDYFQIRYSPTNLDTYVDDDIPVSVSYVKEDGPTSSVPEATAVYDSNPDEGEIWDEVPFVVHGLAPGDVVNTDDMRIMKAMAVKIVQKGTKVLSVGRSEQPLSTFTDCQLYARMFPWLFPYGLGGVGNGRGVLSRARCNVSATMWKRQLLMCSDKRFQRDPYFILLAFNHEQIKQASTGGYLLTERRNFQSIVTRIMTVDTDVLDGIASRLKAGQNVIPSTEAERKCFDILKDVDVVAYSVHASVTSKRKMRSEIWSTICQRGAPLWFITLSPPDNKNPIALFFADDKIEYSPIPRSYEERARLVAENPVASALFFDHMCRLFIKYVLGLAFADRRGIFGPLEGYYGTVEQQGRLTLHLHILVWVRGAPTPDQIRQKLREPSSEFRERLVRYLDGCHSGQLLTSSVSDFRSALAEENVTKSNPIEELPTAVPPKCEYSCTSCMKCFHNRQWWDDFRNEVDEILFKSNVHSCAPWSCGKSNLRDCRARFPRDTFEQTVVNDDGSIDMKKREPMMNFFSPVLTYLFRCNTDVTSLLSGTAVKAVVAYVTDYITKQGLKTTALFDVVKRVFDKDEQMQREHPSQERRTRTIITQVVNSLTALQETGSPMASMYLLGNPDHYTDATYVRFYWRGAVSYVGQPFESGNGVEGDRFGDQVSIYHGKRGLVPYSTVLDYVHRPDALENLSLYDFVREFVKCPRQKKMVRAKTSHPSPERLDRTSHSDSSGSDSSDEESERSPSPSIPLKRKRTKTFKAAAQYEQDDLYEEAQAKDAPIENSRMQFLPEHPQYESKSIARAQNCDDRLVDFVTLLPRRDSNDRSFYCQTMLTLFSPWRKGTDLRDPANSWAQAYDSYRFTERDQRLMRFFNIRYECLDSRDDFHAQRKAKPEKSGWLDPRLAEEMTDRPSDLSHGDVDQSFERDAEQEFDNEFALSLMNRPNLKTEKTIAQIEDVLYSFNYHQPLRPTVFAQPLPLPDSVSDTSIQDWKEAISSAKSLVALDGVPSDPPVQSADSVKPSLEKGDGEGKVSIVELSPYWQEDGSALAVSSARGPDRLSDISSRFRLNEEQRRAFTIILEHHLGRPKDQLLMYLGGMGGTGKSQVIKAVTTFFMETGDAQCVAVLAPTGTAAALLGGSTYHSFLGVGTRIDASDEPIPRGKISNDVQTRIMGLKYIVLDEVSMLCCSDLNKIANRLAFVRNCVLPFGGVNMIFAGDFAQLQPPRGTPLYRCLKIPDASEASTQHVQDNMFGKALWLQVNTVVMLVQNMRQRSQSEEDGRLRTALENLRYQACTKDDIDFFASCEVDMDDDRRTLVSRMQRTTSIITCANVERDAINKRGAICFAEETGQTLQWFYAHDSPVDAQIPGHAKYRAASASVRAGPIGPLESRYLHKVAPNLTKNSPGAISLCKGIPVMLKRNDATELGITNGAEGTVVDWVVSSLPITDRPLLDVVFVALTNPVRPIQISGLPLNVVPVFRRTERFSLELENGQTRSFHRSQVPIVLNFAMTDYASQGRSRPENPIYLTPGRPFQSIYTSLSRTTTAAGTILLRPLDESRMRSILEPDLLNEFRSLETMNVLTRMRFNGTLDHAVKGVSRNELLVKFFASHPDVSVDVHPSLAWSDTSWVNKDDIRSRSIRSFVDKTERAKVDPVKSNVHRPIAHRREDPVHKPSAATECQIDRRTIVSDTLLQNAPPIDSHEQNEVVAEPSISPAKNVTRRPRGRAIAVHHPRPAVSMTGLKWDSESWSCSYDVVFGVLYHIWRDRTTPCYPLTNLSGPFQQALEGRTRLEDIRDWYRGLLHRMSPETFPVGSRAASNASAFDVLYYMTQVPVSYPFFARSVKCPYCDRMVEKVGSYVLGLDRYGPEWQRFLQSFGAVQNRVLTVKDWVRYAMTSLVTRCECGLHIHASGTDVRTTCMQDSPIVVVHTISKHTKLKISSEITVPASMSSSSTYKIRAVIYFGEIDSHFTARFVTSNGTVFEADGRVREGRFLELPCGSTLFMDFDSTGLRRASFAIYDRCG